jgi:tetratricopeptide (TPR) repeat protein
MDRMTTRTLEQEVQKALGLYKVSNPTEFSRAVWPVLGMMAVSSAGASPRFDAVLQMAATTMDSDNKIIDEPGHNSYVLDDITARVWGAIGNAPNAERKYLEALADAQATSFTDEAERDTALAWIYDDLTRFADDHNQYINIIAYQDASNLVGGTNHSDYPYETCYAYDGLKHYSEAVTECTRLIEGNGNYIQTHYWRAKAYENLDELDEALADYGPIADKGNSWFGVGAAIAMSVIYGKKNDFAGQLASMNKHSYVFDPATQTSDDLAVAYNNRCFAYMKLGRMQKAMDDCTTSLKYGHIPDAVQKQQELIRLGVKSTPIGPDLVARVRTVSPAMVTLAFAAMVLLVRLALPWRRKPSVEISDDLAASRDSLSRYQEMVVISSGMTRFYKFAFPTFWFMFIAVTLVIGLTTGAGRKAPAFFVGPCFMAVFGFFAFKRLIWVLVDEVKDGGTFLIVRNRGKEITVPLSEIMNVSTSTNTNPPRVTLRLSQPGDFGAEIVFVPATKGFSINPFKKNTMVEDLILRVDQARRSSAR